MVSVRGRRIPLVPVALVLALGAYVLVWAARDRTPATEVIEGSGTIEATQVHIAGRAPGRIREIRAAAGQAVRAGETLVVFEAQEVDAQVAQAEAAVAAARSRLAQAEAALHTQRLTASSTIAQAEAARESAAARVPQAEEALQLQQEQTEQQIAQARAAVATAEAALAAAQASRASVRANLRRAEQDLARATALLREGAVAAQAVDAARAQVEVLAAQEAAAAAQEAAASRQVEQARAALAQAEAAARQVAIRRQDLAAARAQQAQADAAASGARAAREAVRVREEDVATARAVVAQAEAALQGARALQATAVVTSPLEGVVLSRSAEPGEVVGAGVPLLVVADLRTVWLRIYVPEALLGRLRVGQDAGVYVDAFPLRPFPARVVEIAGVAEFVPRNIATQQERAKLVFAVRLTLDNTQGLLKPGMPADARIRAPAPP